MTPLKTTIERAMQRFGFKVLGLRLGSDREPLDERRPMRRKLRARAVVRDQRPHHPCYDLCYLVDVRSPYPTEEFKDVGKVLDFWRDYYREEYSSEVQFVYQAHDDEGAAFYVVRQLLNASDDRAAREFVGENL